MLRISRDIVIDENDLDIAFVRASGPGGQNVNKVATAVQRPTCMRASSASQAPA